MIAAAALSLVAKLELVRVWRKRGELAFQAAARYAAAGDLERARRAELEAGDWLEAAGELEAESSC